MQITNLQEPQIDELSKIVEAFQKVNPDIKMNIFTEEDPLPQTDKQILNKLDLIEKQIDYIHNIVSRLRIY